MADRCRAVQQEPGCQQFEVFQSALDPDKLVVLELLGRPGGARRPRAGQRRPTRRTRRWSPSALTATRPREDYTYNRAR